MDEVVQYLQNIEKNLVGLILPALITASVSLLTIAIQGVVTIVQSARKHNSEQFKQMQIIYPKLRELLQSIWIESYEIKTYENLYGGSIGNALHNYYSYLQDEDTFRSEHQHASIDQFISTTRRYIDCADRIKSFFGTNLIPLAPSLHFLISIKVSEMLTNLQRDVCIICRLAGNPEELNVLNSNLAQCTIDDIRLKKYINMIDKWFRSYR